MTISYGTTPSDQMSPSPSLSMMWLWDMVWPTMACPWPEGIVLPYYCREQAMSLGIGPESR